MLASDRKFSTWSAPENSSSGFAVQYFDTMRLLGTTSSQPTAPFVALLGLARRWIGSGGALGEGFGEEPFGALDHEDDQEQADEHLLGRGEADTGEEGDQVLGEAAALEKAQEQERAEDGAAVVAAAAQDEGEPDEERLLGQEHVGLDVGQVVAEEDAGEAGDRRADHEGLDLEADHRLAGDGSHRLVLSDGAQHAAERRAPHALEERVDQGHGERHHPEVEE